jgi:DeoR/GlpR family transcriptional regulator of sugar metabolism
MLEYMNDGYSNLIYTNSIKVLEYYLSTHNPNLKLYLFGGYCHNNINLLESEETINLISKTHIDKLFLGTVGVSIKYGLSCSERSEILIRQALIKQSDTVILLADSSKIGKSWHDHFAELSDIDYFITDSSITDTQREALENSPIKKLFIV